MSATLARKQSFRLDPEPAAAARRFRALHAKLAIYFTNAAGKTIWKKSGIERGSYGLTLSIPAANLKPGGFRVEIEGNPPELYYFAVGP